MPAETSSATKNPKVVIASTKSWNLDNARRLRADYEECIDAAIISQREHLTPENLQRLEPDWVFFPRWSWTIPDEVISEWRCVIFHTSPLPWGRGGSPIQNQIERGVYRGEVCALQAVGEVDAGPVYLREQIDLSERTVEEVLMQGADIAFDMIRRIIFEDPESSDQRVQVVLFKRRKPQDLQLPVHARSSRQVYDHIRMLDGEGYPPAYLKHGNETVELRNARLHPDGTVTGTFRVDINDEGSEQ